MSDKTIPDMKEIFRQAAEIAAQVPEVMQVAAFNRALDMLTGQSHGNAAVGAQVDVGRSSSLQIPPRSNQRGSEPQATTVDELIAAIDTTQHPAVASAGKVLDRALMVLQIALRNHGLDGLTPPEIARILTEKFRLSTTSAAVTMALGAATTLVNRIQRGKAYEYKIMGPGEEYLSHLGSGNSVVVAVRASAKSSRATRKKSAKTDNQKVGEKTRTGKTSGRAGPKEMLENLIRSNYFSVPQDISQIIEHLQTNHARTYKSSDLSPALTRLLRENRLERKKNEKGIFQYTSK